MFVFFWAKVLALVALQTKRRTLAHPLHLCPFGLEKRKRGPFLGDFDI